MPMHDWTKVDSYIFHHFHTCFIVALFKGVSDRLPPSYYAMAEQSLDTMGPDILTLQSRPKHGDSGWSPDPFSSGPQTAVLPEMSVIGRVKMKKVGFNQKQVAIRHKSRDRLVAILEIVSPGNKSSRKEWKRFVSKATAALQNGVHVFIIDPFPPPNFYPRGTHDAIWQSVGGKRYVPPVDQPQTYASYESSDPIAQEFRCFVQPGRPGEALPEVPLFLEPERFINVPLEELYSEAMEYVLPQHLAMLQA